MVKKNSLLLILILIIVVVNIGLLGFVVVSRSTNSKNVQDVQVAVTSPVYSVNGKIVSTKNSEVIVQMTSLGLNPDSTGQSLPSFTVKIGKKTLITKLRTSIPYQLLPFGNDGVGGNPTELGTMEDLTEGKNVLVVANEDLRFVKNYTFTANSIQITPESYQLSGEVTQVNANAIQLNATLPNTKGSATMPEIKSFTVTISSDTEISMIPSESTTSAVLIPFSQLRQGMIVSVYTTDNPATTSTIRGMLIKPVLFAIPPKPTVATSTATTAATLTRPSPTPMAIATSSPTITVR